MQLPMEPEGHWMIPQIRIIGNQLSAALLFLFFSIYFLLVTKFQSSAREANVKTFLKFQFSFLKTVLVKQAESFNLLDSVLPFPILYLFILSSSTFFFLFVVLEIEPKALCMPDKFYH